MTEIFLIAARRTPFGSLGGQLAELSAPQLAATVIGALLDDAGLPPEAVEEVIIGQVLSGGCGQAPARQAMRLAALPDRVPALTINKVCGSGLKAIMLAAGSIALGDAGVVVAGGMESMSRAPHALLQARAGYRLGGGELVDLLLHDGLIDPYSSRHMGEITETWITRHGLGREEQDAYALRSYQLAQAAVRDGRFREELAPVLKKDRKGETLIEQDEEPFKVDFARLPTLKPAFRKDGTITAGNASTINDGAALALLAGEAAAKTHGLKPRARLVAVATESTDPALFAEAPVEAIRKVLRKAGLKLADIDLFEINEAFAAVPLLATKQLDLDPQRVNVHGGAVALGHPIGASGGRLLATLVRELHARKGRYGLATLCIGGGEAVAVIIERV
ncbi:MAG: thiolase family protein [Desulfuromonadales bacterium]|nr:thiolase family protein [Desulfuromonadales bacterium]